MGRRVLAQLRHIWLISLGIEVYKGIRKHDLSSVAAEFAYHVFLALFPFFVFVAAVGGFVADLLNVANPTDEIMSFLGKSLPADSSSVLRTQIESVIESRSLSLVSIGIAASLWIASGGVATLMKGMNRVYEAPEQRPYLYRLTLSIGLTMLSGVSLVSAFILLIIGDLYGLEFADKIGLGGAAATGFTYVLWPLVSALVFIGIGFVYWLTPCLKLTLQHILPGALLFTVAWLGFSLLFGAYVSNFGSYNTTYGTLGAIIVILVWLYLSSYLLFIGAEINASMARHSVANQEPAASD